jgi:hypothetical protein
LGSDRGYDEDIYDTKEEYLQSIPVTAEDEQKEAEEETQRRLYFFSQFLNRFFIFLNEERVSQICFIL